MGLRIRITGAQLRHLRTLRFGVGARLVVFDERGEEHDVRVEHLGARVAEATVLATRRPARESALDLTLAPALLKGAKMDLVVEKATELGVRRIAPVTSRHAVTTTGRTDRWQRIAVAAAKQSGRTQVPAVDAPRSLPELVRHPWPGLRLLAWEAEPERALAALPERATAVVVVVGRRAASRRRKWTTRAPTASSPSDSPRASSGRRRPPSRRSPSASTAGATCPRLTQ